MGDNSKEFMNQDKGDFIQRLKSIIDTAIDGIITIDDKGVVETINPSAAILFEYDAQEVIGSNVKMLMPSPYHDEHDGYIHRYQKTKEPHIIGIGREVSGKTKSGSIFPMRLAVSEVILNNRVIYTGIIHDLSDVKKAELEIINLNKQLEEKVEERTYELEKVVNKLLTTNKKLNNEISEKVTIANKLTLNEQELKEALEKEKELNELKSRFVSMASHEFRTPLTTIMSSAALISKYPKEAQQPNRVKHVERIKSAVVNLTGILNDFLSLSKLEEGKINVEYTEVDILALFNLVSNELKGLLKTGQYIRYKSDSDTLKIQTDGRILKNILFNLLSNAIKYSAKDIECTLSELEGQLTIKIKDKGIGIPLEDQKYLFTRFFRAGNVTSIQGTGLGLNIVRRYVDLLKGSISFKSVHEAGTTFTVNLPIEAI